MNIQSAYFALCFTCKTPHFIVEPRGFEPLTSAVQRRHYTFLDYSVVCKVAAKVHFSCTMLFLSFQVIYSGCCTIADIAPEAAVGGPWRW
jgi:hypothetical protein